MKVVILCGGQGTRIRDVSEVLPKPMLPVGDKPILWHIMKIYAHYGYNDFVLCLGYKGWMIKEYFLNYYLKTKDFVLDFKKKGDVQYLDGAKDVDWKITFCETGEAAQTATRLWSVKDHLKGEDAFALTYGDGVADINISKLAQAHKKNKQMLTVTGVHPLGRFGEIEKSGDVIKEFNEKPNVSTGMINGGFMIFDTKVFGKYFNPKVNESLEGSVIPRIVKDKKAGVYAHQGNWQCVDTAREYNHLNELWNTDKAFWKIWR